MSELDLERGDPERAEAPAAERKRAASKAARENKSKSTSSRTTAAGRVEAELASRLDRTFDRIADALEAREDTELATTIREDKAAMGQGLVSLTRSVKPLRSPLLMFLNLVEPVLAFGRVGRILAERLMDRRARIFAEREAAAAETQAQPQEVYQ